MTESCSTYFNFKFIPLVVGTKLNSTKIVVVVNVVVCKSVVNVNDVLRRRFRLHLARGRRTTHAFPTFVPAAHVAQFLVEEDSSVVFAFWSASERVRQTSDRRQWLLLFKSKRTDWKKLFSLQKLLSTFLWFWFQKGELKTRQNEGKLQNSFQSYL